MEKTGTIVKGIAMYSGIMGGVAILLPDYPLALPPGMEALPGRDKAFQMYLDERQKVFAPIYALFNSKEAYAGWSKMKSNPLFVNLARKPEDPRNKKAFGIFVQNDIYFLKQDLLARKDRLKLISPNDVALLHYEKQKLEKFGNYIEEWGPGMTFKLGITLRDDFKPNDATMQYVKMIRDLSTDFESTTAARVACSIGWSLVLNEIMHDPQTVKKGPFYEEIMRENCIDSFLYKGKDGKEATEYVFDGLSGTARRSAQQMYGFLYSKGILQDKVRMARFANIICQTAEAEYGMLEAAYLEGYKT